MDIFGGNVPTVDLIDLGGDADIFRHPGNRDLVENTGVVCNFIFPDLLFCLKEPGPARNADRLQRRGDGKYNSLICPAIIRHQKVALQGIVSSGYCFHGGVIGF